MVKLDLENVEESEIKLSTSVGSYKSKSSRKTSTALLTMTKPLTVWITTNCGKFSEMGIPGHLTCLLRNLYTGQEATVRTGHGTDWFQIWRGVCQGSNFLDEISSLSHSVVILYFFALIAEEGFLISPSYSLELCKLLFSETLFLHCCPSDKFFSTIFLDSIYIH